MEEMKANCNSIYTLFAAVLNTTFEISARLLWHRNTHLLIINTELILSKETDLFNNRKNMIV